ncbi:hypothetical protein L5515_015510 [Caenorhabditis briggsae]|uniref:Uncharacterized protein n=1 Tax=Caenorhabditis briggsae TaxID=6238 RepID=A0AAE9EED4_CAEBR|nr:hypothetical protein L5515_015510 [Caenorhabditis briggsae]
MIETTTGNTHNVTRLRLVDHASSSLDATLCPRRTVANSLTMVVSFSMIEPSRENQYPSQSLTMLPVQCMSALSPPASSDVASTQDGRLSISRKGQPLPGREERKLNVLKSIRLRLS